jgi:Ni,Fe-hydrogenase III small subunit
MYNRDTKEIYIAMVRVYRINTGSCGACDVIINEAVAAHAKLTWADSPQNADALLLTGPITPSSKAALVNLLRDIGTIPIFAIGRCAIDGHPFGKGGIQATEEIVVQIHHRLDECPPAPETIAQLLKGNLR